MEPKPFIDYLKKIAPGTKLRTVIDDLTRAGLGALIVFNSQKMSEIIEGGFRVNCLFTPQKLFELAKMDGAIILSENMKRILYANVSLVPDTRISTNETGTRHKAAERTAKQAETFTIAVSKRKKKTTIYCEKIKYYLKSSNEILRDLSSTLQILEKQKEILSSIYPDLNILEMSELTSTRDVVEVIQRIEVILKIFESVKRNFIELGKEGGIMNLRYKELLKGVEKKGEGILRDYSILSLKKSKNLLSNLSFEGILDIGNISKLIIGREIEDNIPTKGYRFLKHLNLTEKEISLIVYKFTNLSKIFKAESKEFESILKNKSSKIKEEITELREQILAGKIIC